MFRKGLTFSSLAALRPTRVHVLHGEQYYVEVKVIARLYVLYSTVLYYAVQHYSPIRVDKRRKEKKSDPEIAEFQHISP